MSGETYWQGVLYAPNGLISGSFSSGGTPSNGCMIGWIVDISASSFNLTGTPDLFPPVKPVVDIGS